MHLPTSPGPARPLQVRSELLAGAGDGLNWRHRVARVAFPTWAGACGIEGLAGLAVHTPRKPAAGHLVYLCGGSRSFTYRASPRCEGLAWCTTSLQKATVGAATK